MQGLHLQYARTALPAAFGCEVPAGAPPIKLRLQSFRVLSSLAKRTAEMEWV